MTDSAHDISGLVETLRGLLGVLEKVPLDRFGVARARESLRAMIGLLTDPRHPAFAVVGPAGSGKSSLINALLSGYCCPVSDVTEGTAAPSAWFTWRAPDGGPAFDVFDTRGVGGAAGMEATAEQLESRAVDVALFVCTADQVKGRFEPAVEYLERALAVLEKRGYVRPPVIPVLNQVDRVLPRGCPLPPVGDAERATLNDGLAHFAERLAARMKTLEPVPVVSYVEWEKVRVVDGGAARWEVATPPVMRRDGRWNVDVLLQCMIAQLPVDAAVGLGHASRVERVQRDVCRRIATAASALASALALVPLADAAAVPAVQLAMVHGIARVAGRRDGVRSVPAFLRCLGLVGVAQLAVRQLLRELIALPWVRAGGAASATMAIGRAAELFFVDQIPPEEVYHVFQHDTGGPRD